MGTAQSLTLYDGMDYGVTGNGKAMIAGKAGGFGWRGAWIGAEIPGLAAWWPLDNSAVDAGPLGANGVLVGGNYVTDRPSQSAWSTHSLKLGASREYVDLSAHVKRFDHLISGSITAWVRTTSTSGRATVIFGAKNQTTMRHLYFYLHKSRLHFHTVGELPAGRPLQSFTELADDLWHHVAVTLDSTGYGKLYVDGQFETGGRQGFFGHALGLDGMWIGQLLNKNFSRWFDGQIDDVAIWGVTLTPEQLQTLASVPPPMLSMQGAIIGPTLARESLASSSFPSAAFATMGLRPVGNRFSENTGFFTARPLANRLSLYTDQTYYMSCLLQLSDIKPNPGFEIFFTSENGPHLRFGWNNALQWLAGFDETSARGTVLPGQPYFVVLKVAASATGTDTAYLKAYAPSEAVHADANLLSGAGPGANQWSVVHGGESNNAIVDAMWLAPPASGASIELDEIRMGSTWESVTSLGYGSGCLGVTIDKTNRPAIGSTDFDVKVVGASPATSALLCLGGSRTQWGAMSLPLDLKPFGAPTCSMLTSIDASVAALTDGAGNARITLPVPNQTSLVGTALHTQWISMDATTTNPLALAFSNAMEVVFEW